MEAASPNSQSTLAQSAGRFIRRLALVATLGATALAAAYFCALHYAGEAIRSHVEEQLRQHYEPLGLSVEIKEARFVKDRGIILSNVTLREKFGEHSGRLVAAIDEIRVEAEMCLHDLVDPPPARGVTISGARCFTSVNEDFEFSIDRLTTIPALTDDVEVPPIRFENASLTLLNEKGESAFTLEHINALLVAKYTPQGSYLIDVRGDATSKVVNKIDFAVQADTAGAGWVAQANIVELATSPSTAKKLPAAIASRLKAISGVHGKVSCAINARNDGAQTSFELGGRLTEARIEDDRLPYALIDLSADIFANNQGIRIANLKSRNGIGWLDLNCTKQGFSDEGPLRISGFAKQLVLDDRLRDSLPPELQKLWREFDPEGAVNLEFTLDYDGQQWTPNATVNFLNVSFAHQKFPYRLTQGRGAAYYSAELATINLQAQAQQQTVFIEGSFRNPGENHTGSLTMRTGGPIQLDKTLKEAMPTNARDLIEKLQLQGAVSLWLEYRRDLPQADAATKHAVITLQDCAVQFEHFAYPIKKITGTLEITDNAWLLRNLHGQNGSASIACNGSWRPKEAGGRLTLNFDAADIPLNEDLRSALAPDVRQVWNAVGPRGDIDNLQVRLQHDWPANEQTVSISATKWNRPDSTARAISLQAESFPYRLENVTGTFNYRNGRLSFERVTARHNDTRFNIAGWLETTADRSWRCALTKFHADELKLDRDLLTAAPRTIASNFANVQVEGPMTVSGQAFLSGSSQADSPQASWDLTVDLENGAVSTNTRLEHIHGGVRLTGSADRNQLICRGELNIDSAFTNGAQLTNIRGPIWTDGKEIFAGSWSPPVTSGQSPQRVTADLMGGKLLVDAKMRLQDTSPFVLQAAFTDGDLTELARQTGKPAGISGSAFANLEIRGTTAGLHTLQGRGSVRLRDARVGELPVMVGLLKLLRVKEPNQTAFDKGDIDFTIEGDNLYFDRLDLKGDAITLRGIGEMNFDRQLNLYFYSVVGRDNVRLPLVTPALWVASRQLLLIKVEGALEDPVVQKEVFPGVNELLQQAFPESGDSPELPRPNDFLSNRGSRIR